MNAISDTTDSFAARSCAICACTVNTTHSAKEFHLGGGETFTYLECGNCGCVQILDKPDDLSKYYPNNYYSYCIDYPPKKDKRWYKARLRARNITGNPNIQSILLSISDKVRGRKNPLVSLQCVVKAGVRCNDSILDVGCGNGGNLLELAESGYQRLTGVDLFIENDISYPNGVQIFKKSVYDLQSVTFDFITLHHSFEHMDDPLPVLQKLRTLLNPGKLLLLRMPVADGYGWENYRGDWIATDAPRHLMIHTKKSMEILVEKSEMVLECVDYESSGSWLIESERRRNNGKAIDDKTKKRLNKLSAAIAAQGGGDCATFYVRRPL